MLADVHEDAKFDTRRMFSHSLLKVKIFPVLKCMEATPISSTNKCDVEP